MKNFDIIDLSRSSVLGELINKRYGGIQEFCQQTGEDYGAIHKYLNQVLKMGDKVARRLEEEVFKVTQGYLDKNVAKEKVTYIPIVPTILEDGQNIADLIQQTTETSLLENSTIEAFGWNIDTLIIFIAKDDSMEPSIPEGAKAIVDYSQKNIQPNKVYAIRIFNDIYLRRINKSQVTGNIVLTPDSLTFSNNTNYEKLELKHDNFEIVGRVVFLKDALI